MDGVGVLVGWLRPQTDITAMKHYTNYHQYAMPLTSTKYCTVFGNCRQLSEVTVPKFHLEPAQSGRSEARSMYSSLLGNVENPGIAENL